MGIASDFSCFGASFLGPKRQIVGLYVLSSNGLLSPCGPKCPYEGPYTLISLCAPGSEGPWGIILLGVSGSRGPEWLSR